MKKGREKMSFVAEKNKTEMKSKKEIKLYNVIFPIWILWIIPITWIIVLPANFIIDLLVVVLTMKFLKVSDIRENEKAVIARVWIMGFVADFIGTLAMFMAEFGPESSRWWSDNITYPVSYSPFDTIFSFLWVTACVMLTAFFIYLFNSKWCLKKANLDAGQKKKVALSLAVFTAPYLFYLPTKWFF